MNSLTLDELFLAPSECGINYKNRHEWWMRRWKLISIWSVLIIIILISQSSPSTVHTRNEGKSTMSSCSVKAEVDEEVEGEVPLSLHPLSVIPESWCGCQCTNHDQTSLSFCRPNCERQNINFSSSASLVRCKLFITCLNPVLHLTHTQFLFLIIILVLVCTDYDWLTDCIDREIVELVWNNVQTPSLGWRGWEGRWEPCRGRWAALESWYLQSWVH